MLNEAFMVHAGLSQSNLVVNDPFGRKENNFWADTFGMSMSSSLFFDQDLDMFVTQVPFK